MSAVKPTYASMSAGMMRTNLTSFTPGLRKLSLIDDRLKRRHLPDELVKTDDEVDRAMRRMRVNLALGQGALLIGLRRRTVRIALDGGIGSGKTTLGAALCRHARRAGNRFTLYEEDGHHGGVLEAWLRHQVANAAMFQMWMYAACLTRSQLARMEAAHSMGDEEDASPTRLVVIDRSPSGNECFAAVNSVREGTISAEQYGLYSRARHSTELHPFGGVELSVVLHVTPEECMARMTSRARPEEIEGYAQRLDYFRQLQVALCLSVLQNLTVPLAERGDRRRFTPQIVVPWNRREDITPSLRRIARAAADVTASARTDDGSADRPLPAWMRQLVVLTTDPDRIFDPAHYRYVDLSTFDVSSARVERDKHAEEPWQALEHYGVAQNLLALLARADGDDQRPLAVRLHRCTPKSFLRGTYRPIIDRGPDAKALKTMCGGVYCDRICRRERREKRLGYPYALRRHAPSASPWKIDPICRQLVAVSDDAPRYVTRIPNRLASLVAPIAVTAGAGGSSS